MEGGTGDDRITAGNGRNTVYGGSGTTRSARQRRQYVDPGGAPDVCAPGNGNNVVNGGSGGLVVAGERQHTIYSLSGPDRITLGGASHHVYLANIFQFAKVDCGGNPQSVCTSTARSTRRSSTRTRRRSAARSRAADHRDLRRAARTEVAEGRHVAALHAHRRRRPDKLFGGHGGGSIDGKGGDNVLWADWIQSTAVRGTVERPAHHGGRWRQHRLRRPRHEHHRLGNGRNFRAWRRLAQHHHGRQRLQHDPPAGQGPKHRHDQRRLRLRGVVRERQKPTVRCEGGAKGVVVYGNTRPNTNCADGGERPVGAREDPAGARDRDDPRLRPGRAPSRLRA